MGWIFTIFDLPVGTKEERQAATKFRNWLLDDGYMMIQYSVYARPCVSYEHMEKHTQRILAATPDSGFVKIMFFTDKQWELSINIIDFAYKFFEACSVHIFSHNFPQVFAPTQFCLKCWLLALKHYYALQN
jgi:CRISPR-associated protein Cas2